MVLSRGPAPGPRRWARYGSAGRRAGRAGHRGRVPVPGAGLRRGAGGQRRGTRRPGLAAGGRCGCSAYGAPRQSVAGAYPVDLPVPTVAARLASWRAGARRYGAAVRRGAGAGRPVRLRRRRGSPIRCGGRWCTPGSKGARRRSPMSGTPRGTGQDRTLTRVATAIRPVFALDDLVLPAGHRGQAGRAGRARRAGSTWCSTTGASGRGCRAARAWSRCFTGPSGHRQDDGRRGGRARAGPGPLPDRPVRGRVASTSARPRRTWRSRSTRPSGRGAVLLLRRGRLAVRQAHRVTRRARPLRQPRGQLPAAAGGDVHRAGDPGDQPRSRAGRGVPAPAAVRDPLRRRPTPALRERLWRRSLPARRRAAAELDWDALAGAELAGGSIQCRPRWRPRTWRRRTAGRSRRITSTRALRREYQKLGKAWAGLAWRSRRERPPLQLRSRRRATPDPHRAARRDQRRARRPALPAACRGRGRPAGRPRGRAHGSGAGGRRGADQGNARVVLRPAARASSRRSCLFQYNPAEVTRRLPHRARGRGHGGVRRPGRRRRARRRSRPARTTRSSSSSTPPTGWRRSGPLTTAFGISPRLAAIEMLMQPVGSLAARRAGRRARRRAAGGGDADPGRPAAAGALHLGPDPDHAGPAEVADRSTRPRSTSCSTRSTPPPTSGFTVLRTADLPKDDKFARRPRTYYQGAREVKAVLSAAADPGDW